MDVGKYFTILRRGWVWLLVATLVGGAAGFAYSLTQPKVYAATSTVYLSVASANTSGELVQGGNYTTNAAQSYARMASMPIVLKPVIESLRLDRTPAQVAQMVRAQAVTDTQLISITASSTNPETSAELANAVAKELDRAVKELSPTNKDNVQQVRVTPVAEATTPTSPKSPNTQLNVALGAVGLLTLMVAFLVLRELFDTRVRTEEALKAIVPLPVLASVPHDADTKERTLVLDTARSARAEAFRQLRTNLQYIDYTGGLRSLVVTSSVQGEGKTSTAINLAESTTALGVSVLLVDADLRRPRVSEALGIEGSVGLSTVLAGLADPREVIQQYTAKGLYVLPAGHIPPNPSELLGSQSMAHLLHELTGIFDLVILDAAPVLPVTDPTVLSMLTDGVVVVANAKKTTKTQIAKTYTTLEAAGVRLLGTVLNEAPKTKSAYYETASAPESTKRWAKRDRSAEAPVKSDA